VVFRCHLPDTSYNSLTVRRSDALWRPKMIDQLATPLLGGRPIFCGDRLRESFENPEKIKWSDQAKAPLEVRLFGL